MKAKEIVKEIGKDYYQNYYGKDTPFNQGNLIWNMTKFMRQLYPFIQKRYDEMSFVDLGAGTGALVKEFRDLGVEADGYEINEYALENRRIMANKVLDIIEADSDKVINKNHNCADIRDSWIVRHRKGATSSSVDELGVIPGNMADWTVIVKGKGNLNFLWCSSHWAGRTMSRTKAKERLSHKDFEESMEGIVSDTDETLLDESKYAYKDFDEVLELQKDSIEIIDRLTPLVNVKWE